MAENSEPLGADTLEQGLRVSAALHRVKEIFDKARKSVLEHCKMFGRRESISTAIREVRTCAENALLAAKQDILRGKELQEIGSNVQTVIKQHKHKLSLAYEPLLKGWQTLVQETIDPSRNGSVIEEGTDPPKAVAQAEREIVEVKLEHLLEGYLSALFRSFLRECAALSVQETVSRETVDQLSALHENLFVPLQQVRVVSDHAACVTALTELSSSIQCALPACAQLFDRAVRERCRVAAALPNLAAMRIHISSAQASRLMRAEIQQLLMPRKLGATQGELPCTDDERTWLLTAAKEKKVLNKEARRHLAEGLNDACNGGFRLRTAGFIKTVLDASMASSGAQQPPPEQQSTQRSPGETSLRQVPASTETKEQKGEHWDEAIDFIRAHADVFFGEDEEEDEEGRASAARAIGARMRETFFPNSPSLGERELAMITYLVMEYDVIAGSSMKNASSDAVHQVLTQLQQRVYLTKPIPGVPAKLQSLVFSFLNKRANNMVDIPIGEYVRERWEDVRDAPPPASVHKPVPQGAPKEPGSPVEHPERKKKPFDDEYDLIRRNFEYMQRSVCEPLPWLLVALRNLYAEKRQPIPGERQLPGAVAEFLDELEKRKTLPSREEYEAMRQENVLDSRTIPEATEYQLTLCREEYTWIADRWKRATRPGTEIINPVYWLKGVLRNSVYSGTNPVAAAELDDILSILLSRTPAKRIPTLFEYARLRIPTLPAQDPGHARGQTMLSPGAAESVGSPPPDREKQEREAWDAAQRYIESVIHELPKPREREKRAAFEEQCCMRLRAHELREFFQEDTARKIHHLILAIAELMRLKNTLGKHIGQKLNQDPAMTARAYAIRVVGKTVYARKPPASGHLTLFIEQCLRKAKEGGGMTDFTGFVPQRMEALASTSPADQEPAPIKEENAAKKSSGKVKTPRIPAEAQPDVTAPVPKPTQGAAESPEGQLFRRALQEALRYFSQRLQGEEPLTAIPPKPTRTSLEKVVQAIQQSCAPALQRLEDLKKKEASLKEERNVMIPGAFIRSSTYAAFTAEAQNDLELLQKYTTACREYDDGRKECRSLLTQASTASNTLKEMAKLCGAFDSFGESLPGRLLRGLPGTGIPPEAFVAMDPQLYADIAEAADHWESVLRGMQKTLDEMAVFAHGDDDLGQAIDALRSLAQKLIDEKTAELGWLQRLAKGE